MLRQTAVKRKPNAIVPGLLADATNSGGLGRRKNSRGAFVFSTECEFFNTPGVTDRASLRDTSATRDLAAMAAAPLDHAQRWM
jgi:hypothetical protein